MIELKNIKYSYKGILLRDKRNELLIHMTKLMNLKVILLNKRSQTKKAREYDLIYYRPWKR